MSEMAAMLKTMSKGMGLHLLKNPAGTWSFVGSVPYSLAYERLDGQPVTEEEARKIANFGAGLFKKTHKTWTRKTEAEAREAARALGYVMTCPCCKEKP
jgi:hypothetical protein